MGTIVRKDDSGRLPVDTMSDYMQIPEYPIIRDLVLPDNIVIPITRSQKKCWCQSQRHLKCNEFIAKW